MRFLKPTKLFKRSEVDTPSLQSSQYPNPQRSLHNFENCKVDPAQRSLQPEPDISNHLMLKARVPYDGNNRAKGTNRGAAVLESNTQELSTESDLQELQEFKLRGYDHVDSAASFQNPDKDPKLKVSESNTRPQVTKRRLNPPKKISPVYDIDRNLKLETVMLKRIRVEYKVS